MTRLFTFNVKYKCLKPSTQVKLRACYGKRTIYQCGCHYNQSDDNMAASNVILRLKILVVICCAIIHVHIILMSELSILFSDDFPSPVK